MHKLFSHIKGQLVALLLYSYIVTAFLSATHVHADETDHHDNCDVCIIMHNFIGTDIPPSDTLVAILDAPYICALYQETSRFTACEKPYHAQAPPNFFFH